MTAGKRDIQTALVGERCVLSFVAALVLAQGCRVVPNASSDPQPDLEAIATVITEAYRSGGFGRPVLFLDTGQACDSISPSCGSPVEGVPPSLKTRLEANLHVKVRPESDACRDDETLPVLTPVLCDTREVGVSVALGRFRTQPDGTLTVDVMIARGGLDGEGVAYTIEPSASGWTIIDATITAVAKAR